MNVPAVCPPAFIQPMVSRVPKAQKVNKHGSQTKFIVKVRIPPAASPQTTCSCAEKSHPDTHAGLFSSENDAEFTCASRIHEGCAPPSKFFSSLLSPNVCPERERERESPQPGTCFTSPGVSKCICFNRHFRE